MKIYTSYFYQVRFFPSNLIPLSTAIWDPKWFHDFKGQSHIFIDGNGVLNGLRCPQLVPGPICHDECRGPENCAIKSPYRCDFLRHYREQLDKINISEFLSHLEELTDGMDIAFLFHEAPNNPCSERRVVQEWLRDNGMEVKEWEAGN